METKVVILLYNLISTACPITPSPPTHYPMQDLYEGFQVYPQILVLKMETVMIAEMENCRSSAWFIPES